MERMTFILAGALPIVAAFGAIIVGLGLVVFGDNGSDTKMAQGSTAAPTASGDASVESTYGIGWLGVGGGSTPSGKGVAITEVVDGSPAKDAGLAVGDLILKFDGNDVNAIDRLASLVQQHSPGDEVTLAVVKDGVAHPDGEAKDVDVTLAARPAESEPSPGPGSGEQTGGGWLGVSGKTADAGGIEVTDVVNGGPADGAGIAKGDLIIAVDGETMESFKALASLIRTHSPGYTVTITVEHDGDTKDVEVTLGSRPANDLPDIGGLLPDLGGILDGFSLDKLIGGQLQYLDADGNVVTLSADAGEITIHPPKGDDKTFDLPSDAHVPDNLAEGDNVIVISKNGEVTAVISTDLSKLLPFGGLPHFNPGGDFFPDGILPHCTVDQNGVHCDIEVKPSDRSTDS